MSSSEQIARDLIKQVFCETVLVPADVSDAPVLARYVAAVTPGNAPLLAGHGVPTLGEELAHLLSTIGLYLDACAPGRITTRQWHALVLDGSAYAAFEELRREAEGCIPHMQLDRELNFPWLRAPASVRRVLLHLADHTAHHRGRLAVLMRMCGLEPPAL